MFVCVAKKNELFTVCFRNERSCSNSTFRHYTFFLVSRGTILVNSALLFYSGNDVFVHNVLKYAY